VTFQCFARRKIFLLVRRGDESSPTALLCGTLRERGCQSDRSAARLWTTSCGFEASEPIPFPGADSIFSSPCGAISGQTRDRSGECGGRAFPAARFLPRFLNFQSFARRKISPSFIGGEFANRRRSSSAPLCFARKTAVGRDLRERSAMVVSGSDEGHSNNIPRFCFSERKNSKISKAAISPSRTATEKGGGISIEDAGYRFRLNTYDDNLYHLVLSCSGQPTRGRIKP
jgi:hypothetical protein